ncbi:MAG: LytTR family DNA-binding domain-containing protein [Leptothrix sp. (in: b-proteobacteria)]
MNRSGGSAGITKSACSRWLRESERRASRRGCLVVWSRTDSAAPKAKAPCRGRPDLTRLNRCRSDYIEAQADYVAFHHAGRVQRISELEAQLDPLQFVRVHRGFIINLGQLQAIERTAMSRGCAAASAFRSAAVAMSGCVACCRVASILGNQPRPPSNQALASRICLILTDLSTEVGGKPAVGRLSP